MEVRPHVSTNWGLNPTLGGDQERVLLAEMFVLPGYTAGAVDVIVSQIPIHSTL